MTSRRARRNSLHEVETSPDGRYIRFDEKLGSGAYKDVYLCYDTETGQEVSNSNHQQLTASALPEALNLFAPCHALAVP